jgi:hypothetical protein
MIGLIIYLISIPLSIIALQMDESLFQRKPHTKKYAWGYFLALQDILLSVGILFLLLYNLFVAHTYIEPKFYLIAGVLAMTLALNGYYVIQRKRWSWILMILLYIWNPLVTIINIFYLRNRWAEMREKSES